MVIIYGCQFVFTAVTMKFTLGLLAVLAIVGLGQAHQFPDFGKGPLHEDLQDFLDLIPMEKITDVVIFYADDAEVQAAIKYLQTTTILKDLMIDFQAIPEVTNLLNYLHKAGVDSYHIINFFNKALGIKELVPPTSHAYSMTNKNLGGISGLLTDIKKLFNYDDFISTYVDKMKNSPAFIDFINQLKSDNFQQIVNKFYTSKSCQTILKFLKAKGVNTKVLEDILYLVLGITVPSKTLEDELMDFVKLIPTEKFVEIVVKYVNEDEKVKNALQFMFTTEFHGLLRAVEALEEHQALVVYLEKAGLPIIKGIQAFHEAIGMEKYVPPKIESLLKSKINMHEIGDGMKGMLKDLYEILPLDEIDALYKEKLKTSKVFAEFIVKITSPEMQKMVDDLYNHPTYKEFITKTREKGLELQDFTKLVNRMFGIKFPY